MGHLARPHPVHRRVVGVVEHNPKALVSESKAEWEPDMAASTENRDVATHADAIPDKLVHGSG